MGERQEDGMKGERAGRRSFLKSTITTAAGVAWASARPGEATQDASAPPAKAPRIGFAAIGLNHDHINGQVATVIGGGGELVSFFAKEADPPPAFSKRFPKARLARSEEGSLEDPEAQLVLRAAIPSARPPPGIHAM